MVVDVKEVVKGLVDVDAVDVAEIKEVDENVTVDVVINVVEVAVVVVSIVDVDVNVINEDVVDAVDVKVAVVGIVVVVVIV